MGARQDGRMVWMDAVRGTAIVLLLLWHAWAVPAKAGLDMPAAVHDVNAFFQPYRMPTLMLLSGLLLARSLSKPLPAYYAGKFAMILWPYLVWVVVAKLTFLDVEGVAWWHPRAWYAISYLWFLFFIGVYYLVAPLVARIPAWIPVAVAAVAGIVLHYGTVEQRMAYFAVFFFAGDALGRRVGLLDAVVRRRGIVLLALPVVAFGVASSIWTDQLQYAVWGAPASLAGSILLVALFARGDAPGPVRDGLAFVGRSSIVFYVSHYPLMALLAETSLRDAPVWVLALVDLVVALLVGAALALLKDRVPVAWLFRAPAVVTTAVRRLLDALLVAPRRSPAA